MRPNRRGPRTRPAPVEGEGQGGCAEEEDQFVPALVGEDAGRGVHQEEGADHVDGQQGGDNAGEYAQDEGDAAGEFEAARGVRSGWLRARPSG